MKLSLILGHKLLGFFGIVLSILLMWQLCIWFFQPPTWLFPSPSEVYIRFVSLWQAQAIQHHIIITLVEIVLGYLLGIGLGFISGYPISQVRTLEKLLTPYLIAANSIPLVAFAPLLLLWFGNGISTKIIVTALIVYFPVTISTISGFHQQEPLEIRLMHTLRASKWQLFIYLELPSAAPGILAGLKIAAPLAVVGAVVGEFLGTGEGLGHLILEANGLLDTAQLFVAIIILALVGISFYLTTVALETLILGNWHHKRRLS